MMSRENFIKVRLTDDEKCSWQVHARNRGTDVSTLVRELYWADMGEDRPAPGPSLLEELDEMVPEPASVMSGTAETFGAGWPD